MDKEKFINKLNEELEELKGKELLYFNMRDSVQEARCTNRIFGIQYALNFARLLDEPQKVKVPAFVAKWIELCKEKADVSSCLNGYYEIGNGTMVRPRGFSDKFYDWLADCDHMDDLARAWLDGYEVEEEQKWVVKSNRLYFTGITQLIARDPITYNFTTDEKRAHVFDDKESAEKEASFFDGTIEKVEE